MSDIGKVLVIGSANMDLIMQVDHLPSPGETVGNAIFVQKSGGKGANQAIAARRAGANVVFYTCLGNDMFGNQLSEIYHKEGINTDYIKRTHIPNGVALINVDQQTGENSISVAPGANGEIKPIDIDRLFEQLSNDVDLLIVQNEIPLDSIKRAINIAAEKQIPILYNPAPFADIGKDYLQLIDYLILNETEAKEIIKEKEELTEEQILRQLQLDLPNTHIVITLGAKGVIYIINNQVYRINAYPADVVDTTGAGDTFCGYLGSMIAQGFDLDRALSIAVIAAGMAVEKIGAQEAIPVLHEVLNHKKSR